MCTISIQQGNFNEHLSVEFVITFQATFAANKPVLSLLTWIDFKA